MTVLGIGAGFIGCRHHDNPATLGTTPDLHRRVQLRGAERMQDFGFAAQVYRLPGATGPQAPDLPRERDAMFPEAMRDFLALAFGGNLSDNTPMPRLDPGPGPGGTAVRGRDRQRDSMKGERR